MPDQSSENAVATLGRTATFAPVAQLVAAQRSAVRLRTRDGSRMEANVRIATALIMVSAGLGVVACNTSVTPRPYPVSATAAIEHSDLEVPRDLEVRSASYSVTGLPDVSGINGTTSSTVQVRPLLTVYAVHRTTGEHLLLIYEDLSQRKQPSRIIRMVPADSQ